MTMKKISTPLHLLFILFLIGISVGFFYYYQPTSLETSSHINNIKAQPTPSPTNILPSPIPSPTPTININKNSWFRVPFTSQAPMAEWEDSLQQDGCEEASSLMAVSWAREETFQSPQQTLDKLKEISYWQQQNYDSAIDTSAQDTLDRIIIGYFNHQSAQLLYPTKPDDIIKAHPRHHRKSA